ncbi:MAG: hypothetical protein JNN06_13430 [Gemmobacter sp.]|uniref:hypothetical protein n=1 Tax=Gemmobacter sp. TaxID=1898957 RepID=UPI001A5BC19F|nr:hypothetical protein [Gemmobacter sp.]MBL8563272.1 hypothetical protein [Gemmobacter sp.]
MAGSEAVAARTSDPINSGVILLENDPRRALRLARVLERRGARIVGLACDPFSALAIAEGEHADFAALDADTPPDDLRWQTAAALFARLGIPALALTADGTAKVLRNGTSPWPLPFRPQGDRPWHLGRTGRGF